MKMKHILFLILAATLLITDSTEAVKAQTTKGEYKLVFSDEFNLPNGSQPNEKTWKQSPRGFSTWNRWIRNCKKNVYIKNGKLVCRAIPNTLDKSDTCKMFTGAVETQGKYSFKYGKIEARIKTNLYKGSFPAFWLMPQPPAPNHPHGGEIDIFECIDKENIAYQTVHSNWTLNLKKTKSPENHFGKSVRVDKWHVYGLEWTENLLIWYIDGEVVASYQKSKNKSDLANGQWPFDRAFYIILNQSVGNGGWASKPNTAHTYETQFDWVRVYQRK